MVTASPFASPRGALEGDRDGLYAELSLGALNDRAQRRECRRRQRLRHVICEKFAGRGRGRAVEVAAAGCLPVFAHAAVDQPGLRLATHMLVGAVEAQKVAL